MWTNISCPPCAGARKPKPRSSFQVLSVPVNRMLRCLFALPNAKVQWRPLGERRELSACGIGFFFVGVMGHVGVLQASIT